MDAEERHWTEDSELIERFVLNTLDPAERNELEDHLRICEVCKQAVRSEQFLIAGIRRSGRERFKADLARKLRVAEESRVPWPHILSAAAVVVIVISVVLYNRWFEIIKPPEIEGVVPAPGGTTSEEVSPERTLEQPQLQARRTDRTEIPDRERDERLGTGAGAARAPMTEAEPLPSQPMALSSTASDELWLEGRIVESVADMLNAPAGEETPAKLYKSEEKDAARGAYGIQRSSTPHHGVFHLRQELLASLPASRRKTPKEAAAITTSIYLRGDTTVVTLYLDTLMDASALGNATLEMPSADSLILSLPDRRIIYRLPEGWDAKLRPAK